MTWKRMSGVSAHCKRMIILFSISVIIMEQRHPIGWRKRSAEVIKSLQSQKPQEITAVRFVPKPLHSLSISMVQKQVTRRCKLWQQKVSISVMVPHREILNKIKFDFYGQLLCQRAYEGYHA